MRSRRIRGLEALANPERPPRSQRVRRARSLRPHMHSIKRQVQSSGTLLPRFSARARRMPKTRNRPCSRPCSERPCSERMSAIMDQNHGSKFGAVRVIARSTESILIVSPAVFDGTIKGGRFSPWAWATPSRPPGGSVRDRPAMNFDGMSYVPRPLSRADAFNNCDP